MSAPIPDLVFDLGLHHGLDTEFYLRKGFRVVALEARPDFCAEVSARFAAEVEAGRLTVVPCALYPRGGETISFWVNPVKDDWNSVFRDFAAKAGHAVQEISVPTVTTDRPVRPLRGAALPEMRHRGHGRGMRPPAAGGWPAARFRLDGGLVLRHLRLPARLRL